jgi:ABC-type transport system substrate-binding protein
MPGDPRHLDPARASASRTQAVIRRTHEGLVALDPVTGQPEPGLAESWVVSRDGRRYTFRLRSGVTFHDGRPLQAADAAYSLTRLLDPEVGSQLLPLLADVAGAGNYAAGEVEGIRATAEDTLVLQLERPFGPLLLVLSMPQASILPAGAAAGPLGDYPGTGPFQVSAWERGQHLDLAAFPDYWNGAPQLAGVRFLMVQDATTALEQFLAGELDVLDGLPPGRREELARQRPGALRTARPLSLYGLGVNHAREPLGGSAILRRALAHAVDREFICRELNEGKDEPALQVLPPGVMGYNARLEGASFNLEEAARLLRRAGHPGGRGLPTLRAAYPSADRIAHRILERLQGDLAGLGVSLEVDSMDFATFVDHVNRGAEGMAGYDLYRLGWDADFPDPDALFTPLLHSASIGHDSGNVSYRDETLDLLLEQARRETDPARRAALYRSASHRVDETVALIPIYWKGDDLAVQPHVKGLLVGVLGETATPLRSVELESHPR